MSQNPHGHNSPSGSAGNDRVAGSSTRDSESSTVRAVKNTTSKVIDQAKERAASMVESQKSTAAERLGHVAQAIRSAGNNLDDDPAVSRLADRAADTVERFSESIRQHEWSDIVESAEDFARRNPALFIGGAFAAGLLIARFLKSSRHQRFESQQYPTQMSGSRFARGESAYFDEGDSGDEDEYSGESLYGSTSSQYGTPSSGGSRGRGESGSPQSGATPPSSSPGASPGSRPSGSTGESKSGPQGKWESP